MSEDTTQPLEYYLPIVCLLGTLRGAHIGEGGDGLFDIGGNRDQIWANPTSDRIDENYVTCGLDTIWGRVVTKLHDMLAPDEKYATMYLNYDAEFVGLDVWMPKHAVMDPPDEDGIECWRVPMRTIEFDIVDDTLVLRTDHTLQDVFVQGEDQIAHIAQRHIFGEIREIVGK